MRNLLFFLLLFGFSSKAQIKLNNNLNLYQYNYIESSHIKTIDSYKKKLIESGFNDFILIDNNLYAKNFFTKMIYGSAMEIHYSIKIEKLENGFEILFSNFKIHDSRYGTVALEELKNKAQKKWIDEINQRIPEILNRIN